MILSFGFILSEAFLYLEQMGLVQDDVSVIYHYPKYNNKKIGKSKYATSSDPTIT